MKELRVERKISQEALANAVDVSRQTILFLEKGKYNPSLRLAWRISVVLAKPIEDIFIFEDEEFEVGVVEPNDSTSTSV
jgi:DNA-binding XRE family transcriptional regulator